MNNQESQWRGQDFCSSGRKRGGVGKKKHNKSCMSTNWNLSEIKTIREGVTTITGSCILTDTIMMASYLVRYQKNYFN